MAAFPNLVLTNAGIALQNKVQGGAVLELTNIQMGSGQLNGQPIGPLTALISSNATVPIQGGQAIGQNTYQVEGFFTNADLSAGFWWREIGIFANDPDNGEILYAYANAGDAGDYIPTVTDQRIEKYIYFSMALANATTVNVTIPQTDTFVLKTEVGQPNGVAGLGENGAVPIAQGGTGATTAQGALTALGAMAADATGADIPVSSSDQTSISASLSNKVSRAGELVPLGTNILPFAPGRYSVDGVSDADMANSMNLPVLTWHYEIDVIAAANATGLVSNYKAIIVYPSSNVVLPYINIMNYEGEWTGWTKISTATPPQEQNLMLSSGWNIKQGGHAMFFKTQENVVHVIMSICSNAAVSAGDVIATIPVGFRPAKLIQIPIICKISGQSELKFGHLDVGYDGTFRIYDAVSGTEIVTEMAISPFSFLAAN